MRAIFIVLVLFVSSCVTTRDDPKLSLSEKFELIAFSEEHTGREVPLHKLDKVTVRFIKIGTFQQDDIDYDVSDILDGAVRVWIAASHISGLSFTVDGQSPGAFPTVTIALGYKSDLDAAIYERYVRSTGFPRQAHCYGVTLTLNNGEGAVLLALPIDMSEEIARICYAQEFVQGLGLVNDFEGDVDSMFRNDFHRWTMSDLDKQLLEILYDGRLSFGMSKSEAMPIVREIIAEKWPNES